MAFHLESPALTLTGKKKGKKKFASSSAKRKAEQLASEWKQMQQDWNKLTPKFSSVKAKPQAKAAEPLIPALAPPPGRESTKKIPSLNSWVTGTVSSKPTPQYTGSAIIGIAVQHKSCLQPIFSESAAKDSASMRR